MMEKFLGTKEATGSVWFCVEQTGPPLSLTPWSGGLATFFLSSAPLPSPCLHELASPLYPSLLGAVLKRSERRNESLQRRAVCN